MALFGRSKKTPAPAPAPAAAPAKPAAPAAPKFDATRYGLVPDSEVALDPAHGDATLTAALRACRMGDWQTIAAAMAETAGDWDRRYLHVSILADEGSETDYWIQNWRREEPDSPEAAILFAEVLHNQAAQVRGGAWAKDTSREQLEGFHRLARDAAKAAQRAIELAPEDPTPWVTRIVAARGQQLGHDEFLPIWEGLIARAPLHRRGHTQAHQYWLKKWFGSNELAEKFVTEESARAPRSAMAFELRLHFVIERWLISDTPIQTFFRSGPGRPRIDAALADYWTGRVPEGTGLAVTDGNLLAWALTQAERYDEACTVWEKLGGQLCMGYPWMYYKDKAGAFRHFRRQAFEKSSREPVA